MRCFASRDRATGARRGRGRGNGAWSWKRGNAPILPISPRCTQPTQRRPRPCVAAASSRGPPRLHAAPLLLLLPLRPWLTFACLSDFRDTSPRRLSLVSTARPPHLPRWTDPSTLSDRLLSMAAAAADPVSMTMCAGEEPGGDGPSIDLCRRRRRSQRRRAAAACRTRREACDGGRRSSGRRRRRGNHRQI